MTRECRRAVLLRSYARLLMSEADRIRLCALLVNDRDHRRVAKLLKNIRGATRDIEASLEALDGQGRLPAPPVGREVRAAV